MWAFAAQVVISLVLTALFSSSPDAPDAATLEDFDAPMVGKGDSYAVIFGTFLLKSANVLWYGDLRTTEVKTSGGK